MKRHQLLSALAAIVAVGSATVTIAQTPPQEDETTPRAASSPHQRESTTTEAKEAPTTGTDTSPSAASTPHQKETTHDKVATGKTKAEREQMMSDCMKREQTRNSSMTADQVRKTCVEQMKKMEHGNMTEQREDTMQQR